MSDDDQDKLLRLLVDKFVTADATKASGAHNALDGPVLIPPKPSRQRESSGAPDHHRFSSYMPESSKPSQSESNSPVSNFSKASPEKAASKASKERRSPSPARAMTFFMDALMPKTPQSIRDDLERLYQRASKQGASPDELVYPWKGSRLFYDPALSPHVYVAHWRWGVAESSELRPNPEVGGPDQQEAARRRVRVPHRPSVRPLEAKASGFTPILTEHGSYTAVWKRGTDDDDEEEEEDSGSEEEDSEEDKPPPPKKVKPSRSSSDSSGESITIL
ncbi:unnamed protein product [Phytophthora fragariaefolia]|uniref:Unnamed protein product n=1 Tax=Phytophthora fragariaefolia TaxID=1490495 RepID=A0A9W6X9J4_9STRA|nr:unnamed protein product [Phytophthora fragariaefolia]